MRDTAFRRKDLPSIKRKTDSARLMGKGRLLSESVTRAVWFPQAPAAVLVMILCDSASSESPSFRIIVETVEKPRLLLGQREHSLAASVESLYHRVVIGV